MRTSMKLATLAAVLLLLGFGTVYFMKYQQTSTALASLKTDNETTRGQYTEALASIASIQDSLNAIVLGDEAVRLAPGSYNAEHGLSQSQGDEILDRIGLLRASIERSKERIQQLDDNLKKSGTKIEGLEKILASLRKNVAKKESQITELEGQVASLQTEVTGLNTQVAGLTTTVEDKQREIGEKSKELGTVYYMMGSKKDLTLAGAVVAKGGVLGMGKTLQSSGHIDESKCQTLDTDQETTVEIPAVAKNVQVVTPQPSYSYALEASGDHTVLRILDPKEFRKVRHLVIVTTT